MSIKSVIVLVFCAAVPGIALLTVGNSSSFPDYAPPVQTPKYGAHSLYTSPTNNIFSTSPFGSDNYAPLATISHNNLPTLPSSNVGNINAMGNLQFSNASKISAVTKSHRKNANRELAQATSAESAITYTQNRKFGKNLGATTGSSISLHYRNENALSNASASALTASTILPPFADSSMTMSKAIKIPDGPPIGTLVPVGDALWLLLLLPLLYAFIRKH